MISYSILDQTHTITDKNLKTYIRDLFFEIKLDFSPIFIHHDIEVILDSCKTSHLVVFGSGHTAINSIKLKKNIEEFCQQDFLIAGQIIYHVNSYPFLHQQMFIVNMDKYRELDCPAFGCHEESQVLELHKPMRSEENIHDDYTPLWLKPSEEVVSFVTRNFGWNIIRKSLDNNIPVLNLSNGIRWNKRYLYPTMQQHLFSDCIQKLAKDELKIIPTQLDYNQKKYLEDLMSYGKNLTFLFNTERLIEPIPKTLPKKIFGLASGFKLFILWHLFGEFAEVVYYDYNPKALELWQNIVENWDGNDLALFTGQPALKMNSVFDVFGTEENFKEIWKRFQNSKPKFIHCDIIRNPQPLLDEMLLEDNYVWYSNIFKYFETIRYYGIRGSEEREQKFLNLLPKNTSVAGATF
jgi:hypothetical protein